MRWPCLLAWALLTGCRSASGPLPDSVVVAYPSGAVTLLPFASNEEFNTSILANVYETLVGGTRTTSPGSSSSGRV
jgi:hypothetical protein